MRGIIRQSKTRSANNIGIEFLALFLYTFNIPVTAACYDNDVNDVTAPHIKRERYTL